MSEVLDPKLEVRENYRHTLRIPTRLSDIDVYQHVNNVQYYAYFDTLVNDYMIRFGGLDMARDPVIGLLVESGCRFHKSLNYPETIDACLRTVKLGNSSARHEIALFRDGDRHPAATGHFVHVFVERGVQRPVPIPPKIRACLEKILV
ncbi:MAG TPA: thioesterase family protein [Ferrovibrio sp.]|uniref:acyl-CoA thioesterase n=1 Tax=Ferrovibrio sp. TaxID=1917215 RepID=UPI002B4AEBAB|nr:thioesterase family protein [Ferrovibrio sp.]HLT77013.1 thioesterase family protein [Ferrovibrio sp.]